MFHHYWPERKLLKQPEWSAASARPVEIRYITI